MLKELGGSFSRVVDGAVPRMIVAVDGLEKQGKSHFALTAPGPIAYQGADVGLEGVIEKFKDDKEIFVAEYGYILSKGSTQAENAEKAAAEWTRFMADYRDVLIPGLKSKTIRTGVWDTGTDLWEFLRMSRFGKLTQVPPFLYTAVNQEYQQLIKEVYDTPGNLVILHKLKAEWKDNPLTGKGNKTGNYERQGYAGTGYAVQINVEMRRDENGEFHLLVKDCRQNPACMGLDLMGPMATFPFLGVHVFPGTDLSDWM